MKGIYCLHLKIGKKIGMKVGSLGFVYFPKGNYIYVGSAQNSLEKRILRHFSKSKKIRWHIDYLLKSRWVKIKKVFYKIADKSEECKTATLLFKFGTEKDLRNSIFRKEYKYIQGILNGRWT